jgi:DNA polymerase delta subunit 1
MLFQAIAWDGQDEDDQYIVRTFGRTSDGKSVCLTTEWNPFFYVRGDISQLNLENVEDFYGKDLWGFQNNRKVHFSKLTFSTHKKMRNAYYAIERHFDSGQHVYEYNIDPVLRFMHCTHIPSTGWIDTGNCEADDSGTCDINLKCPDWTQLKPVARDDIAPFRIMSLDIECYSESGDFPDPKKPNDCIFQIATTTKEFGKPDYIDKTCLRYPCTYKSERDLLMAFQKHIQKIDPDIITGWNIFGFDLEYISIRATKFINEIFLGRVRDVPSELVVKNLASNALGNNILKLLPMKGRYVFDLFQDVKREHKLESYSLNNVSKHFLKDKKIDMPVKEMFRAFREKDLAALELVADYCIKDTELPHQLMEKLCQIQNQIEMAKACWVPLAFLSERGQQIKVFSQMAYKARELNFVIPTMKRSQGTDSKFQGATVLDARTGAYYVPITALDFESLYPSIMCAHNLCYSTLVVNKKYDNIEGVEYETIGPHRFAQTQRAEDGTILPVPSLLPIILMDLKKLRKKAKADMAAAKGTPMYSIYNGKQLAYKISMNSIYGFTGAQKGMLPLEAIASTVTMMGRQMIETTKNYVETNFPGAKVRYGDSVMPETPVLIRDSSGKESRPEIQNLTDSWIPYNHFKTGIAEQCETLNIECMTHLGWKKIIRIIRHKSSKKIYRVNSPYGIVDLTEDHSLLDEDLNLIKPSKIREDDILLHFGEHIEGSNYVKLLHDSWSGYVYDLETEAGTFSAGNGTLIVKNTDSVMVEFDVGDLKGQEAIDYSWVQGELAAEQCTKLFKKPNNLELEKVYCPYFLYSKKRYAAKMYEKTKAGTVDFTKIDVKGLQSERRDTCQYVRETLKGLLEMILNSDDPNPAVDFAREAAKKLRDGQVPHDKLYMSKQLASDYKTKMPHVMVRDKIKKRAPGSEPQQGDRVSFLIVRGKGLMAEKAEDPEWVREHNIKVDYDYYFEHQMKKPVCDLLEPLGLTEKTLFPLHLHPLQKFTMTDFFPLKNV